MITCKRFLSAIIFAVLLESAVSRAPPGYAGSCLLPSQDMGKCIPLRSCRSVFNRLLEIQKAGGVISDEQRQIFAQRACAVVGITQYVCCAEEDIQLNPVGLDILKRQQCGVSIANKVSNGKQTELFAYPWMALLIYNDTEDPYRCGGSLITERYVLTAAHCITRKIILVKVRLGEHRISTERDCTAGGMICAPPVEDIEIEEIITPETYRQYKDDITLLRLQRKVQFQYHIRPACLPIYDNLRWKIHPEYIIAGWGRNELAPKSDVLMEALVPTVDRAKCQTILRGYRLRTPITEHVICAGNTNLIDSCDGDSGGPMVHKDNYDGHPRYVQFGIVSFGVNFCGQGDSPNAYTNISHYMQWITDHLRD